MPKKKFGPDDKLFNNLRTYPKYRVLYHFNNSYINNRQNQGQNVPSGSISLFEMNVDRENDLIHPFLIKGENITDVSFKNITSSTEYNITTPDSELTSSYPFTSSVSREILIGNGAGPTYNGFDILDGVSYSSSVDKIIALENTLNYNKIYSPKFDYYQYYIEQINDFGGNNIEEAASPKQKYTSIFCFPSIFKGEEIKPGSVELNFYITGTLAASAADTKQNGELVETYGSRVGGTIGTISYKEGIMILTGNYVLDSGVTDGYLTPVTGTQTTEAGPGQVVLQAGWKDNPRWAHFGAYNNFITNSLDPDSGSYAAISSSYELTFKGTNTLQTLTMFCHADKNEFNWSNNPTFPDRDYVSGSTYQLMVVEQTGSNIYKEKEYLPVKNTISSSFDNYSSSYSDQTFISKINIYDNDGNIIAVGKLAKPVTKTNSTDYTFKLKIDIWF